MTIELFEPDCDSCAFDEAHKIGKPPVISGCNPSELFGLVIEPLDNVPLLVNILIVWVLDFTVPFGDT